MKRLLTPIVVLSLIFSNISVLDAQIPNHYSFDSRLFNWVQSNISPQTKLPYSFYIPEHEKSSVFERMDEEGAVNGSIERTITTQGLVIYDGAVYQIVLSMMGGAKNLKQAQLPLNYYWNGSIGDLNTVRSGYPINLFIYNSQNPEMVTSDNDQLGKRGFIFRIINADGTFLVKDPKDGAKEMEGFPEYDRLHWVDWKPVAGENAWVAIAAMQLYHKKYLSESSAPIKKDSVELRLAEELARAAMILQSDIGGIRMAPIGTHRSLTDSERQQFTQNDWWYRHISTENNISWYSAFRMLYEITGREEYKKAMDKIEEYLHFVWNAQEGIFYQGAYEIDGQWQPEHSNFAMDVQTWAIACLGPEKIDAMFGEGTSYDIWQNSRVRSGVFDNEGQILGVGYTDENDRISVEWSAGAMVALQEMGEYYLANNSLWSNELFADKLSMRKHMETLHYKISKDKSAYSYSSRRGWIPFGWNSHDPAVLSMASTGWMMFVDAGVNPFRFISNKS